MQSIPVDLVQRGDTISIYASYPLTVHRIRKTAAGTYLLFNDRSVGYEFDSSESVTIIKYRETT